ncbi:hypothetical protein ES705_47423 [subsurface metagenome]
MLAIEPDIIVGLILRKENTAAHSGHDIKANIFIFKIGNMIGSVFLDSRQTIIHGIGINTPLNTLMCPAFIKPRHRIGWIDKVCGYN